MNNMNNNGNLNNMKWMEYDDQLQLFNQKAQAERCRFIWR